MKLGDYVRLDRCQGINRIDEEDVIGTFYLEHAIYNEWGDETFKLDTNDVIKSSPNIIDLIEKGDYVNGLKVNKKYEDRVVINTRDEIIVWFEYQIKSIVTKEQFKSMEYKICIK